MKLAAELAINIRWEDNNCIFIFGWTAPLIEGSEEESNDILSFISNKQ